MENHPTFPYTRITSICDRVRTSLRNARSLSQVARRSMRTHFANASYGMVDYLVYPVGMLAVSPIALRTLGLERYGLWMIANSVVSVGAIMASGFGDANIRCVAMHRATANRDNLLRAVRSTMSIHLFLGAAIAFLGWWIAPAIADRVSASDPALRTDSLWSLRIACLLMLTRAIESVCISTQRAFERYGEAVRISIFARLLSLIVAALLPLFRQSVTCVLLAAAIISVLGVILQISELGKLLNTSKLAPSFDREATRALLRFGIFTWIQAISGLLFLQVDRIITGVAFGAVAVSAYAMCVQLSQPMYGMAAAALHLVFPRVSIQHALHEVAAVRRTVILAFCANLTIIVIGASSLYFFGDTILRTWAGEDIARAGRPVFPLIMWSTAASGLSVAGFYSMLALGRVRTVTLINLIAGSAMALSVPWLLHRYGIVGTAWARMIYGPATLVVYIPLTLIILRKPVSRPNQDSSGVLCDEPQWTSGSGTTALAAPSVNTTEAVETCSFTPQHPCANVLGIGVEALDLERALTRVEDILRINQKGYVCAIGVHGILEARRNAAVAQSFAEAIIVVPDGMPMVWIGRIQGHHGMRHVTGPELMREIFRRKQFAGLTHFLYGGKEGVADDLAAQLMRQFPGTRICGTYTPPFRELTNSEEVALIATINKCKPDMIWIGISTPKQELLMRRLLPHLDTRLMFGVGAAFDFHTGRIRDCAVWIKLLGLQWLHRLLQDPKRLWRRNVRNTAFMWHIALQLLGFRKYELKAQMTMPGANRSERAA
jgi:exopolysaccharide biosynthesis WecB/TagA/CpsF family protein